MFLLEKTISMKPIQKPRALNEHAYEAIKDHLTSGQLEFDTIYSANGKHQKLNGVI